jgi:hypothetical protein
MGIDVSTEAVVVFDLVVDERRTCLKAARASEDIEAEVFDAQGL